MIVDALTHIHPDPASFGAKYDLSPEYLVEQIDSSPLDRAVVTAIEGDNQYCTSTEFVAEACGRYPEHLVGVASVHPIRDKDAAAKLEAHVRERGMRGVKLHPRHQGFGVDDPAVVPVVEKAAELGIPVYVCGSQWKHAPLRDQMPMNVDVLCQRVPEAKIIIAHGGGFKFWDAFIVAVANENVYLETSIILDYFAGTPLEAQLHFALGQLGAHRIIYGSDHPEFPAAESLAAAREHLARAGFDDGEQRRILGENIAELLGVLPEGT